VARESHRIAPTAHFTAQAWVREGFPNAGYFDTRTGRLLFGALHGAAGRLRRILPSLSWHEQFLYIRHHAYEARLEALAPDYVLEVGAGLSPRGLTLAGRSPNLVYVEVDLPHMVAAKRACLRRASLPKGYHLQAGDILSPGFPESLPRVPEGARVVVVTEGLTDYLTMEQKRVAWSNLASVLKKAGGGAYLFDVYTKRALERYPLSTGFALEALSLLIGARMDERLFESPGHARELVQDVGFDSAAVHDLAALNSSRHRPPMSHCYFDIIEARVSPTTT
jgi:O-methyltransferase involved in polyketide biosynthesis